MLRIDHCKSKWDNIVIVDDKQKEITSFQLDELGHLKTKLKTQKRRRIHESPRTRKVQEQVGLSKSTADDEENAQKSNFLESNPISVDFQNSLDMNNLFYIPEIEINENSLFDEHFLSQDSFLFDSFDFDISDLDF